MRQGSFLSVLTVFSILISMAVAIAPAWAQNSRSIVERVYQGHSANSNPVIAKQEMTNQAIDKVSEDLIKEIIGENKYNRNKAMIINKIVKNSARYIPLIKPGELQSANASAGSGAPVAAGVVTSAADLSMSLTLKINVDDLQALLLKNGLFYESDSTPIILPAIKFVDREHGTSYAWWMNEEDSAAKAFLMKQSHFWEQSLKSALHKNLFYLILPDRYHYRSFVPQALQQEAFRREDWQNVAAKLSSSILLQGQVVYSKSPERSEAHIIDISLSAVQMSNGRVIAELSRQFETDLGIMESMVDRKTKEIGENLSADLSTQVLEAWQKGSLGSSLYRWVVRGRIPLNKQEAIKEMMKAKVREIKNINERLISSDEIVFEVDSSIGTKQMSQKASELEASGLKIVLDSASETEMIYRVRGGE